MTLLANQLLPTRDLPFNACPTVVANLAELTLAPPLNGTVEVAGPEACPMDKFARKFLAASGDQRKVIADVHWRYFGTELNDRSLTPGDRPRLGRVGLDEWLRAHRKEPAPASANRRSAS
jgi:uncharacterized protein YbjT (DUF2867 family)